ncbi:MAG: hypothetical protein ACRD3O_19615 [Terriglobia bacterium]
MRETEKELPRRVHHLRLHRVLRDVVSMSDGTTEAVPFRRHVRLGCGSAALRDLN